ncbi:MAG: HDOD domain-containing protein [gamma proteobacterium symbiont of Taylorina sp.]|nr:HDOD domain-containing protein [gamma proteobacterium symbiont of Taylorina sp.]
MPQALNKQSLLIEQEKLPSLPHSLLKLLEAVRDPEADFSRIAKIIQTDPALTSRFMSAAHSAAHYQLAQNKDFNSLVVALGLNSVKSIACHSAVQQFFSQFNIDKNDALVSFWSYALSTASLAKALAHITDYHNEDEAYIAGLLHNIGELVCLVHNTDDYTQRSNRILTSNDLHMQQEYQRNIMEQDFIGSSIPEIGAAIIQQFDPLLSDAILYQREPAEQLMGTSHLVQLINAAHKLSILSTSSSFENKENIFSEVSNIFDLGQSFLEEILLNSHVKVLDTAKEMGISINEDQTIHIDEAVQIELADNVRTIALSSSLQPVNTPQFESRPEQTLIKQIIQNLNILFGFSHCLYLAFDKEARQLNAQYGSHIDEQRLRQFSIPLKAVSTLAVKCLIKQLPLSSQDASSDKNTAHSQPSVVDRQLQRLLSAEKILCIPLIEAADGEKYGVLVAGFSSLQLKKVRREKGLLYEFSRSSAAVITQDRNTAKQIHTIVEEEKALQSLEIRKLVHEANNPLGVIRNYLQVLSHKLADSKDEKLPGQLEILMQEVERVGQIVLRIRETPQKTAMLNNQINLNELIDGLCAIFKESLFLKAGITARLHLDPSIPCIESNSSTIKQILTNLFKNAAEAMADGGEISISTRDQVNYNGQQYVELCISDNGPGIPTEILKNLFNPVKTTKSAEHSGLGLSIIKNLVNDLGGTISGSNNSSNNSSDNSGAVFVILLPRKMVTTHPAA